MGRRLVLVVIGGTVDTPTEITGILTMLKSGFIPRVGGAVVVVDLEDGIRSNRPLASPQRIG